MSAAAIASRISYSPAPISPQQKTGQALHVFGYTLARPFQWITEPLIRCVITPLSRNEYGIAISKQSKSCVEPSPCLLVFWQVFLLRLFLYVEQESNRLEIV